MRTPSFAALWHLPLLDIISVRCPIYRTDMPITVPLSFRELLDCMPIAACLLNAQDRCVIAANHAFCELIGFTEQELKELSWPRILHPDYAAADGVILQPNAKTDNAIEWHLQKKDGSPLKVHGKYRLTQVVDAKHRVHELYFTVVTRSE